MIQRSCSVLLSCFSAIYLLNFIFWVVVERTGVCKLYNTKQWILSMASSPDTVKCFSRFWLVWENHCELQKYQHFFLLFKYFVSLFFLSIFLLASIAGNQFSEGVGTGLLHIWNWTSVVSIIEKLESSKIKIKWMLDLRTSLSCYLFSLCIRSKNAFCRNNNHSLHYYPGISNYWIHIKVLFSNTLARLSRIPPSHFPDGKTMLQKWTYLMPYRHFQRNWKENHHPPLLPVNHRTWFLPSQPLVWAELHVWEQGWGALGSTGAGMRGSNVELGARIRPRRGASWHGDVSGVACVMFPSCGSPCLDSPMVSAPARAIWSIF